MNPHRPGDHISTAQGQWGSRADPSRRSTQRLDPRQGVAELLDGAGRRREIAVSNGALKLLEFDVDAGHVDTIQSVKYPVADVIEGEEVAVRRRRVALLGVEK